MPLFLSAVLSIPAPAKSSIWYENVIVSNRLKLRPNFDPSNYTCSYSKLRPESALCCRGPATTRAVLPAMHLAVTARFRAPGRRSWLDVRPGLLEVDGRNPCGGGEGVGDGLSLVDPVAAASAALDENTGTHHSGFGGAAGSPDT